MKTYWLLILDIFPSGVSIKKVQFAKFGSSLQNASWYWRKITWEKTKIVQIPFKTVCVQKSTQKSFAKNVQSAFFGYLLFKELQ